jgi:lysine-specific demethylase/histidyl-hydroxylase NO66
MKRKKQRADAEAEAEDDGAMRALTFRDERTCAPGAMAAVVAEALARDEPASVLAHLLHPLPLSRFGAGVWERHAAVIHRGHSGADAGKPLPQHCLSGLLSKSGIDALLRQRQMQYGLHVDVTRYDAVVGRSTLNDGEAVADADEVWKRYAAGCSVRILHPQRWVDPLHAVLLALERHFNCACGCNAYLTPAGTQGFAPHYDDIDAFVLQLEGRKRWRLYAPRDAEEVLPRTSSENFEPDEIGEPIADVVLCPGDVLYMPRGTIHQAESLPEHHSLHVTLSTGHANCWADLLELALPTALATAAEEMQALRESIPRRFLECVGVMHVPEEGGSVAGDGSARTAEMAAQREAFIQHAQQLLRRVLEHAPLDAAADQLGARFMRTRLPPHAAAASGAAAPRLTKSSRVRLAFAGAARLVIEEGDACVYHPFGNDRVGHMEGYAHACCAAGGCEEEHAEPEDPARLAFPLELAPALEALLRAHPEPVELRTLPLARVADGVALATQLLNAGVLVVAGSD